MAKELSNALPFTSAPMQITVPALLQFLDISPDAIIVINQAGTIVRANRHALALFGYTDTELQAYGSNNRTSHLPPAP